MTHDCLAHDVPQCFSACGCGRNRSIRNVVDCSSESCLGRLSWTIVLDFWPRPMHNTGVGSDLLGFKSPGRAECRRDGPRLCGQADTSKGIDNTQLARVKLALALVPGCTGDQLRKLLAVAWCSRTSLGFFWRQS